MAQASYSDTARRPVSFLAKKARFVTTSKVRSCHIRLEVVTKRPAPVLGARLLGVAPAWTGTYLLYPSLVIPGSPARVSEGRRAPGVIVTLARAPGRRRPAAGAAVCDAHGASRQDSQTAYS